MSHLPPHAERASTLEISPFTKQTALAGSGGAEEGSRGDSERPGLAGDGCGAGGCRDGKEVVVVGVTSGRASAGAQAGRERGRQER